MNGFIVAKSTTSKGPVQPIVLVGDRIDAPNTANTEEVQAAARGLNTHDIYTGMSFFFITTVAGISVPVIVTLGGIPAYKVVMFNPGGNTVYVNFNAAAAVPIAGVAAGSHPLQAGEKYDFVGLVITSVNVIDPVGGIDVHITAYR